ncbi:hypothetical protein L0337_36025 [candidate division KSB1 bacterium]|nr:hypothetical protein [candidate division KSB1 bacterium]
MKSLCQFSLEHYREILEIASQNFIVTNFANHTTVPRHDKTLIILRHDLDSGMAPALEMATLEHALGIRATYFVQLHSDFYDAVSLAGSRDLRRLVELGHEIGLHYDPTYYEAMGWDFRTGIARDLELLSAVTGGEAISVSRHLPLLSHQKVDYPPQVRHDAYDPKFINGQFKYLSDSNGIFREGCFCQHLYNQRNYCFLAHPIWWVNAGHDWREKLQQQMLKDCEAVTARIQDKIEQYEKILAKRTDYDRAFQKQFIAR